MLKFVEKYPPASDSAGELPQRYADALGPLTDVAIRYAAYAGHNFGGGIYRLYNADEVTHWTQAVEAVFPDFAGRIRCFGRDWLDDQFCLDQARGERGKKQVLLFEIGTGQVLEIPESYASFHESALAENTEAVLATGFFAQWKARDTKPLAAAECVGYPIPLFLGGKDDVRNLERTDCEVYWHLTGQLLIQTRGKPSGTKVDSVKAVRP